MSKQPLEGLTVRIFDPPKNNEESRAGSRGFREYTEVVGSDTIRNTNYNWDKQIASADGLKASTKDWNNDTRLKSGEKVQNLSLVSRSDGNDQKSLRNVNLQHELWDHIKIKISEIQNEQEKKKWEALVGLFRKLREGIFASNWSKQNYAFANQVYESSVDCCIKASNHGELVKSLSGLMHLYQLEAYTRAKPYYMVLDILHQCCDNRNLNLARQRIHCLKETNTHEFRFAKQLIKSVSTQNSILFFQLYHNNPYRTFRLLMDNQTNSMRIEAIATVRKAYLSASISWIGKWLGIYHDNNVVLQELERLVKPTCIKSVDYEKQIVHFSKR